MSRRTPLLAAVLSLAAAGLTLGAGVAPAHAATTSTPSIRVTGPCLGGSGVISARSYRTADGGVAVQTRITGVAPGTKWQGSSFVGDPTAALENEDAPVLTADSNGVVKDSIVSKKSWPRVNGGMYFRSNYGAVCEAVSGIRKGQVVAMAVPVAVMLRPGKHVVRVLDMMVKPGSRWRVKVALTGPTGTTRLTKAVTADDNGQIDTRFANVGHLRGVTRTVVRVVNLANGRAHWIRVLRHS